MGKLRPAVARQGSCHLPEARVVPLQGKGPNDSTDRETEAQRHLRKGGTDPEVPAFE